jgi:transcriptional regulator with GAF, ATPase, and Fis domain
MAVRTSGTTHPNAPESSALSAPLALHFVFPGELDGLIIDLESNLAIGREPPDGSEKGASSGVSGTYAVVPHATVSRRHAAVGDSIAGRIPTLEHRGGLNGTFVNGNAVRDAVPLIKQAVVRFGDALAVVDERGPTQSVFAPLPGRSPAMARLREALPEVAKDRAPLLISGETGTGKEEPAAEIHRLSGRSGQLVKFNCAELSPELVESQLFGHERGAFTGATAQTTGLFAAAEGGTLLLDEIAEIPLDLQPKLLRVLQENEVLPLGSTRTRRIDVRVIGATNANLLERVERGAFRRDLYARLAYLELHLPPLRERRQDILGWIENFRSRWCAERGLDRAIALRPQVAERLLLWGWPDNLRGVDRLVHRLLLAGSEGFVGMSALKEALPELLSPPGVSPSEAPKAPSGRPPADRPTREEFLAVYEANGRSVRATSKHFGRDRRQVYRWLEQFGIGRPSDDDE